MATTYQELAEQVSTVHSQARALVGATSTLLRTLQPLVEAEQRASEQQNEGRRMRRVFGQPNPDEE